MAIKVGINGFGRIGRMAFRAVLIVEILCARLRTQAEKQQAQGRREDRRPTPARARGSGQTAHAKGTFLRRLEHRLHIRPRPQAVRKGKSGLAPSSFGALR